MPVDLGKDAAIDPQLENPGSLHEELVKSDVPHLVHVIGHLVYGLIPKVVLKELVDLGSSMGPHATHNVPCDQRYDSVLVHFRKRYCHNSRHLYHFTFFWFA